MDIPCLLAIAQNAIPPRAKQLLTLAARQLALADAALSLHLENSVHFSSTSTSGAGVHQVSGLGAPSELPTTPEEAVSFALKLTARPNRAELTARSFVYELAVMRNAVRAALREADPFAAKECIARFDAAHPTIVPIRDTLAHLNERMLGEAKGKPIEVEIATVDGHGLDPGISLDRGRISGHMANGGFGSIEISKQAIEDGRALIITASGLFGALSIEAPGD